MGVLDVEEGRKRHFFGIRLAHLEEE